MRNDNRASTICILSLLTLCAAACALAQDHRTVHFSGLINDYTPQSPTIKGSPWEMHGQWSMDIHPEWGTADFEADLTMSGYGKTASGAVDPAQPLQNPHTHHIRLMNAPITWNMTGCPAYLPPATTMGFQFTHVVSLLTGNGSSAPFETDPPSSTLQVCVTGGEEGRRYSITNSNITLAFDGPAATHFGSQAIHGVVRKPPADEIDSRR